MPGLDQTGPMGQGSQTGKRMGRCIRNFGSTQMGFGRRGAGKNQVAFGSDGETGGGRGNGRRRRMRNSSQ